jgi:hypothetical protein
MVIQLIILRMKTLMTDTGLLFKIGQVVQLNVGKVHKLFRELVFPPKRMENLVMEKQLSLNHVIQMHVQQLEIMPMKNMIKLNL